VFRCQATVSAATVTMQRRGKHSKPQQQRNFPWRTPVRDLHTALNFPHVHVYDYITKLFRRQAEVIQNHENEHVRGKGQ
jgi:hypothetical protein